MSAGSQPALAWSDWEGQLIAGAFPLVRFLGASAHSAVFLTERGGEDGGTAPKKAAIKLVPGNADTTDTLLARWRQAAGRSHPNLLRLFESGHGEHNGVSFAYLVMDYAEENLAAVDRPLSEPEGRELLSGALGALAFLRQRGLAHGHLQPSNILASDDKLILSSDSVRPSGERHAELDTASPYTAPETDSQGATPAGDIWSLGVTVTEALAKRLPVLEPDSPQARLPAGIPDGLRGPLSMCLRVDPRKRATDQSLAVFLRGSAAVAPPIAVQPVPEARPRRVLPIAAAAVLALAGVYFLYSFTRDPGETTTAIREITAATAADSPVEAATEPTQPEPPPAEPAPPAEAKSEQLDLNQPTTQPQLPATTASANAAPERAQPEPAAAAPKSADPKPATPEPTAPVEPRILRQVLPDVPAQARDTIRGTVTIRVRLFVDSSGAIVQATNLSPDASSYFGDLAVRAAREWQFAPAAPGGPQSNAWTLQFAFRRDPARPVTVQASASLR